MQLHTAEVQPGYWPACQLVIVEQTHHFQRSQFNVNVVFHRVVRTNDMWRHTERPCLMGVNIWCTLKNFYERVFIQNTPQEQVPSVFVSAGSSLQTQSEALRQLVTDLLMLESLYKCPYAYWHVTIYHCFGGFWLGYGPGSWKMPEGKAWGQYPAIWSVPET